MFADGNHFAFLTSPTESTPGLAGQPPLIERLSRYLISPHPNASSEEVSGLLYSGYSQLLIFCLSYLYNPDTENELDDSQGYVHDGSVKYSCRGFDGFKNHLGTCSRAGSAGGELKDMGYTCV